MQSKWIEYKVKAIKLRELGLSQREIHKKLSIPRSTLSGWLRNIKLTKEQQIKLHTNWKNALIKARKNAVLWHNKQKKQRIVVAHGEAMKTLSKIDIDDTNLLELTLAMLYLGEGSKTQTTSMANSNPLIIRFFIKSLEKIFQINKKFLRYELHLRSNQNEIEAIHFWSKELDVKKSRFTFIKDKRIAKTTTLPNYKGVCVVNCGRIAIQRRLIHLAQEFCKIHYTDS